MVRLPEDYNSKIVEHFFSFEEEVESAMAPPFASLRAPKLQRMRTFTKVPKLDLEDEKVAKMAKKQAKLCQTVAKKMDLHTLLELVRHDLHGFGLKGTKPDFSENILSVTINGYTATEEAERPPESIYHNVLISIID